MAAIAIFSVLLVSVAPSRFAAFIAGSVSACRLPSAGTESRLGNSPGAALVPGFFLTGVPAAHGLGAGERLNEHVIGAGWPGRAERRERLSEAFDIIQGLLRGSLTNCRGNYLRLDHARLFDRPDAKPAVAVAAGGVKAARLAGRSGDALIATEPHADLIEEFVSSGGSGPRYAEVALCYAKREEDARKTAHHYFRWSLAGWPVMAEPPDTEGFAAASKHVAPEALAQVISCGPSAEHHLQSIDRYIQVGFDHIILVQTGAGCVHRVLRATRACLGQPAGRLGRTEKPTADCQPISDWD
jgi:G6PDH family F420-dependent oxidoreductase